MFYMRTTDYDANCSVDRMVGHFEGREEISADINTRAPQHECIRECDTFSKARLFLELYTKANGNWKVRTWQRTVTGLVRHHSTKHQYTMWNVYISALCRKKGDTVKSRCKLSRQAKVGSLEMKIFTSY